ncbi:MAG: protein kinase, partial [Phycisphaerales bacterium]|nr:protein kinase [Phycisphaerales bacterium]
LMDHPGIAKVLDAGLTDAHRPFFVMEYVAGEPVTRYCDRHKLSVDERLEIFIRICEAVHHAHMKGIVHRDLKPANVLVSIVDERPAPKVIDFGVAKALHQRLSETPFVTEQGHMIGTPEYMSPEQAEMGALDVDTRADIYSLGVLLYELLTGMLPFDSESLRSASMAEIHRIIREVDPPRPSTKLSSVHDGQSGEVAKNRRLDRKSLSRNLRGDLDWIVMRAMEKDRTRRYESASALADDIRRHMLHEPVNAGPPSVSYKVGKFVRRHTSMVAASTVLTVTILAALATTSVLYAEAESAREQADYERGEAVKAQNEEAAARARAVAARQKAEASLDAVRQISRSYVVDLQQKIATLRGSTPAKLLLVTSSLPALEALAPHYDDPELQATLADGFQLVGDLSVSLAGEDATMTTS